MGLRDSHVECNLQYQTSDIRVYTKFYTVHERRDVYMRGGKVEVFADVTPYVRHLIQTNDRDIVRFEDGMLRGISPGKTSVKVPTRQGPSFNPLILPSIRALSSFDPSFRVFSYGDSLIVPSFGALPLWFLPLWSLPLGPFL